jgi:hypothetical protein
MAYCTKCGNHLAQDSHGYCGACGTPIGVAAQKLTVGRATVAIIASVAADAFQLPLTLAFLSGALSVPSEGLDILIDVFMAGLTMGLLGFHWVLLPTFILEAIPVADAAPTWTACTSFVVWRRKKNGWFEPALIQSRIQSSPGRQT